MDTTVSKASNEIKRLLAATVGANWRGTKVVVREIPTWEVDEVASTHYPDAQQAWCFNFSTGRALVGKIESTASGRSVYRGADPALNEALLIVRSTKALRPTGPKEIWIIVQEGAIDSQAIAVITDALLAGDKKGAASAAKLCGVAGGLCMALAEAHAHALMKGERGRDLTATLVSTSITPSANRARRSAKQLEREIQSALSRRGVVSSHLTRSRR
jgi:hypothetical protein